MKFVKCKNDTEKITAIKEYCNKIIEENTFNINGLKADRDSPLDYETEIYELVCQNAKFMTILEIIEADELTSVLVM